MTERLKSFIKENPKKAVRILITALIFVLSVSFFMLSPLMSDDYYYAAFLKDGIINFTKLTFEHFKSINGRALVHFVLQLVLSMPLFIRAVLNSLILFLLTLLSFKLISKSKQSTSFTYHLIVFYALLMLSGKDILTQDFIWTSGFYNYVFPAVFLLTALYLLKKNTGFALVFSFLSGATTEQWGFASAVVLFFVIFLSSKNKSIGMFSPFIASLTGYFTIFLSPATLSRIEISGRSELYRQLIDLPRLSEAFLSHNTSLVILVIFTAVTILAAWLKKGVFSLLYSGILPLVLLLLLPINTSYMPVFIIFMSYLTLCAVIFCSEKNTLTAPFLFGSIAAVIIMLPTNTFEARITFPGTLMLIFSSISILSNLDITKKIKFTSIVTLFIAALTAFVPSYIIFYKNRLVENENLAAVHEAQKTGSLTYCIDYNKEYTMRQMFNDGWFFQKFLELYDLDDAAVYLDSSFSQTVFHNGKALKSKALLSGGEAYISIRSFLNEAGGTILSDNGTVFLLNNNKLTYLDGIFMYTDALGNEKYLVADENTLSDFYTMYIKLSIINDAFHINVK